MEVPNVRQADGWTDEHVVKQTYGWELLLEKSKHTKQINNDSSEACINGK